MKSLVDDLGKWITAISFARLVVSIVHDWHIILFSVLDFSRSKSLDYLAHAVERPLKDTFRAKTKTLAQSVYEFYPCLGIP